MTTTARSTWIIRPHPLPQAQMRLFCFPYAGGGANSFLGWAKGLSPFGEVCAIELPGRGRRFRDPPFTEMDPLVNELTQVLRPYLDRPFAFFGHSMGAVISFEVARSLLHHRGIGPVHLFVSACRAPQLPRLGSPLHTLPDPDFLEELRRLQGTPESLLRNRKLMEILLPLLRADFSLYDSYHYRSTPALVCPITAFGGQQDPTVDRKELEAWQEQTQGNYSIHLLPGDHFFLHTQQSCLVRMVCQELIAQVP